VQATNGNFYGTTDGGGAYGYGTIFEITGTLTTLHSFDGTDGADPDGGLVQATNGNFYGTTHMGEAKGDGTVFEITSGATLHTLRSFDGTDGANPVGGLVQATNGVFYGTTYAGGDNGDGTVFEITSGGTLTTLHSFDGTDGANPNGGLVQATNGTFYGTTYAGGANGDGTVFSLSVGLGPFVETLPTSGKVGAGVTVLGTNLTGATKVRFNGTTATFAVISSSEIKTTVPAEATTGNIEVTTPSGTLKSNIGFLVDDVSLSPSHLELACNVRGPEGCICGKGRATLTNLRPTAVIITSISTSAHAFSQSNDCPRTLEAGQSCTIYVGFMPGTYHSEGELLVGIMGRGSPLTVSLNGTANCFPCFLPAEATTGTVEGTTPKGTLKSNLIFKVMP
jgi:uncharacterized repeat protein (TIGR03803 family)